MLKLKKGLIIGLLVSLFLGEVVRIPIGTTISVTLVDFISGLIFIQVIIENLKSKEILKHPIFRPLLLFISICLVSLLINLYWLSPYEILASFLYLVRFVFLVSIYFFVITLSKKYKENLPLYMVFTGLVLVLVGLVQYFYISYKALSFLQWDIHWYRLYSTFIDPNFMGVFLTLCFLLSLTLLIMFLPSKKKALIFYLCFSCLVLLSGTLLTFSRTALLSLIAGLFVFGYYFKKSRKIVVIMSILFATGIGIILINYQATEGTKLFRLSSSKARFISIESALAVIKDHPLIGVGFNTYRYAMHKYGFAVATNWQYSHSDAGTDNSFLFVLATTGIVGLLSFSFLFYKITRMVLFGIWGNPMKILALTSIVAIFVGSFFINALFYPLILAWLWIIIGLTETY